MDLQCEGGKGSGAVYSLMRGVPVKTVVRNNRMCVCVCVCVSAFFSRHTGILSSLLFTVCMTV